MVSANTDKRKVTQLEYVAVDAGNRFIKFFDRSGNPHKLPSYIKKLEDWQDTIEGDRKSIVVTNEDGTYVIGKLAKELNGNPAFMDDKIALAPLLILPAIQPPEGDTSPLPLFIKRLVVTLPDSRNNHHREILKGLEGEHTFVRNGIKFDCFIEKVVIVDECMSAYTFANNGGLFRSQSHINGIMDAGGGTTLGKLFTPGGTIIREADIILPGANELARAIAMRLLPKTSKTVSSDEILDGIENGQFMLGTSSINFKPEFEIAHKEWVQTVRLQMKQSWAGYIDKIAEVLIVGGSASLFSSLEEASKGRFKVVPDCQFTSVKGLGLIGKGA